MPFCELSLRAFAPKALQRVGVPIADAKVTGPGLFGVQVLARAYRLGYMHDMMRTDTRSQLNMIISKRPQT